MPQAPFECPAQAVSSDWIDYNGHMNMAYYNMAFDRGVDALYDHLGIGAGYVQNAGGSCFTLEVHVCYVGELVLDDPIRITIQLLDWDAKRLHFYQEMYHATQGFLAATSEQMAMHVDMTSRRSAPFPEAIQATVATLAHTHASLPIPERVGRVIGIRKG